MSMPDGGSSEIEYLAGTNGKFWSDTCCDACGLHGNIKKYCPIIKDRERIRTDNSQIRNYSDHPPGNRNNRSESGSCLDLVLVLVLVLAVPLERR